jgi:RNA polymerase sigma factor (sigma-70 family)
VTTWFQIEGPSRHRKYPAGRAHELDDLLTAVGTKRDGQAFSALFDHFRPRVQAQMVRTGLAPFAAADVTQDVMETIWSKAHLFDRSKSAAATWVFRIAHNRRIDVGRRSREQCHAAEDFLDIPDPAESSDACIDTAQREQHVHAALDALPQEQFKMVQLAFFEGLSHTTIAARTNLPVGTVKSRLRLAFSRLRRLLHDAGVTAA